MPPLPVGTLTLLFSDIEGSTSMLTGLGSRWPEALSAHRLILRAAFTEYGGHEIGTEGDSFFVVFASATQALLAAMTAQRGLAEHDWPDGRALRVRMGLHTGEPQVSEDDYIGLDVVRAARIAAAGHGGQTVISEATHALAGDALGGFAVRDLGWHRLKDLPELEHLFDVTPLGLPDEYPPLRSLGMATNLPSYSTELVGRVRELDEVATMASSGARLVTLTGSGGTGKTRLAVAIARELQRRFASDVYFVPLDTADRAALMWAGIAEAVDAPVKAEQPPAERALEFLRDRVALLVLDNLEQIPEADVVVSQLLSAAPGVSLLATSRRPLHLVEEQQYPLSTFAVPDRHGASADVAEVAATDAVKLFVQRARMVRPGFALTAENVDDVVMLCRRLDGLPLAIELAAARSRLLGPRALLNRIDSWFGETLSEAQRPARQRTLTATISWSYDMLTGRDQRVFRQLGVFSSRVGLDAIALVIPSDGRDPLDVVAHLVDVSLLEVVQAPDGDPVVYMLQTIRRFARERLQASGELEDARLRHAHWCRDVAQEIAGLLHGPRQMSALDRMEAVIEDVRAALDWSFTAGGALGETQFACGLDLLEPMDNYWYRFGYIQEGRGWHERALALLDRGDREDSAGTVDALHGHGMLAVQQNDLATGAQALERALDMSHRLGDLGREARESNGLGVATREQGDAVHARELVEHSLDLARRIGDPYREAVGLANLVDIHMDLGQYAAAVDAARRALIADEALDDPWGVAVDKCNLATALLYAEGPGPAYRQLVDVAPGAIALGDVELSIDVLDCFARVWAAFGDAERSAAALGAADQQRALAGIPRRKPDTALLERVVAPVRQATDAPYWDRAYARGKTLTIEAAVAEESADPPIAHSAAGLRDQP
jgi:predicted ATPase/class 3 adenylate cyclase